MTAPAPGQTTFLRTRWPSTSAPGTRGSQTVMMRKPSTAEVATATDAPAVTSAMTSAASTEPMPPGVGTAAAATLAAR